jgi:hypothetical protein
MVHSSIKNTFCKYIKISKIVALLRSFFRQALPTRGFSIWILLFGYTESDLPTPVSHPPPPQEHTHIAYPPPKFITQSDNTFGGLGNFLSTNPMDVKNNVAEYSAMENQKNVKTGK